MKYKTQSVGTSAKRRPSNDVKDTPRTPGTSKGLEGDDGNKTSTSTAPKRRQIGPPTTTPSTTTAKPSTANTTAKRAAKQMDTSILGDILAASNVPPKIQTSKRSVMLSDSFMDALEDHAPKKPKIVRKKVASTTSAIGSGGGLYSDTSKNLASSRRESADAAVASGPAANIVDEYMARRKICFADEKGGRLVSVKFFEIEQGERMNVTKMSSEDMKHCEMQQERTLIREKKGFHFSTSMPMPPGFGNFRQSGYSTSSSPWKLFVVDGVEDMVERGLNSESKLIEMRRQNTVMEAFYDAYTSMQISEIDDCDNQRGMSVAPPKIIPLDAILSPAPQELRMEPMLVLPPLPVVTSSLLPVLPPSSSPHISATSIITQLPLPFSSSMAPFADSPRSPIVSNSPTDVTPVQREISPMEQNQITSKKDQSPAELEDTTRMEQDFTPAEPQSPPTDDDDMEDTDIRCIPSERQMDSSPPAVLNNESTAATADSTINSTNNTTSAGEGGGMADMQAILSKLRNSGLMGTANWAEILKKVNVDSNDGNASTAQRSPSDTGEKQQPITAADHEPPRSAASDLPTKFSGVPISSTGPANVPPFIPVPNFVPPRGFRGIPPPHPMMGRLPPRAGFIPPPWGGRPRAPPSGRFMTPPPMGFFTAPPMSSHQPTTTANPMGGPSHQPSSSAYSPTLAPASSYNKSAQPFSASMPPVSTSADQQNTTTATTSACTAAAANDTAAVFSSSSSLQSIPLPAPIEAAKTNTNEDDNAGVSGVGIIPGEINNIASIPSLVGGSLFLNQSSIPNRHISSFGNSANTSSIIPEPDVKPPGFSDSPPQSSSAVDDSKSKEEGNDMQRTFVKQCTYYMAGGCHYGEACRFAHGSEMTQGLRQALTDVHRGGGGRGAFGGGMRGGGFMGRNAPIVSAVGGGIEFDYDVRPPRGRRFQSPVRRGGGFHQGGDPRSSTGRYGRGGGGRRGGGRRSRSRSITLSPVRNSSSSKRARSRSRSPRLRSSRRRGAEESKSVGGRYGSRRHSSRSSSSSSSREGSSERRDSSPASSRRRARRARSRSSSSSEQRRRRHNSGNRRTRRRSGTYSESEDVDQRRGGVGREKPSEKRTSNTKSSANDGESDAKNPAVTQINESGGGAIDDAHAVVPGGSERTLSSSHSALYEEEAVAEGEDGGRTPAALNESSRSGTPPPAAATATAPQDDEESEEENECEVMSVDN